MAVYFLDSSALVKRYVSEAGSAWVLGLFDNNEVFIIAVTSVEIVAAITRRSRSGSISAKDAATACNQFRLDIQADYQVVEVTQNIINSAMTFAEIYGLRGYDAIQLAAACAVNTLSIANGLPALTLVSADNELNAAALNQGLVVQNPNNYP